MLRCAGAKMLRASVSLPSKLRTVSRTPLVNVSRTARCRYSTDQKAPPAQVKPPTPQAPPPPPPAQAPKKRSRVGDLFKVLGLTVVAGTGTLAYAYYDPEFKKQVENVIPMEFVYPYVDQVIDTLKRNNIYPNQSTPPPVEPGPIVTDVEAIKKQGLWKRTEEVPIEVPAEAPAKEEVKPVEKKKDAAAVKKDAEMKKKKAEEEKEAKKKREAAAAKKRILEREAEEAADNAALEHVLNVVIGETVEVARVAIERQKAAAKAINTHTAQLKQAMDEGKDQLWLAVTQAYDAKKEAVVKAEEILEKAQSNLEKMKQAIQEGKKSAVTKGNKVLLSAEENLNQMVYDLESARGEFSRAKSDANVMQEFKSLVEKGKEQLKKELESIVPDVKLGGKRGKKLSEDELNTLIAHAHRRIEQLQKQLLEQQVLEQQRINAALKTQQQQDDKLAATMVKVELERQRSDFDVEKTKWEAEADVRLEQELRHQVARQTAAHSDHLADVLRVQQGELRRKFDVELRDHLQAERDNFQNDVAGWIARMKGIEAAVEGRAEAEKLGRQAQELWLACQSLQNSIATGKEGETWEDCLQPLAKEVDAIKEAANNHPYVMSVINTMPEDALNRGVYTEENLRYRFWKVRTLCKRVAMIDEAGSTLFKYFVSYMQSLFIFDSAKAITDETVDPEELDTFNIVASAKYHLSRGNLEQALRYMNQLTGESRRVADDWIREARLLLESRQAARALAAYASATGVTTLQF